MTGRRLGNVEKFVPTPLPRGGMIIVTSRGPVQFGAPPETIKDTMGTPTGVANIFVLTREFFSYDRGISFAEMEFPIYFNFFLKKRKAKVVCTDEQKDRLMRFMQESLFGPHEIDLRSEIEGGKEQNEWYPELEREMAYFRRHPFDPSRPMVIEDLVDFFLFDEVNMETSVDGLRIARKEDGSFEVHDPEGPGRPIRIPGNLSLPARLPETDKRRSVFKPPLFGVTILGSGHGFDPKGRTTGFILWVNRRGIMVDPPVDTTDWLAEREVPARCVDSIILTHCHADHDGGTLQKALQANRIRLYSTPTIYESFLRKAEAITGLPKERFHAVLEFHPVPIRKPVRINGAKFVFNYNLHSIPTIRFETWLGGRSMVYSSDTLNDPEQIKNLEGLGVIHPGRAQDLIEYPWHHDLIIHEAGIPPLHTSPAVLSKLPPRVKKRLYLVHTTKKAIPPGSGLKMAPLGLSGTMRLKVAQGAHVEALNWLQAMRAVDHFRHLPVEKAIEFAEIVQPRTFRPGELVMRMGDPGDYFYMILAGKAKVIQAQTETDTKVYGMYDYFGETSLILDIPRTADVQAISELKVLMMAKEDFLQFIRGTAIFDQMARLFVNRGLKSWPLMDKHPVLSDMNASQRTELQSFMDLVQFEPGETLLRQGTEHCVGYLVAQGKVEEIVNGRVVRVHNKGDLAASVSNVLESRAAPHSLRAGTRVKAYMLAHEPFKRFLGAYPGLYLRLLHHRRDS